MHARTLMNLKNIQWIKSYPKEYVVYKFFIYMYICVDIHISKICRVDWRIEDIQEQVDIVAWVWTQSADRSLTSYRESNLYFESRQILTQDKSRQIFQSKN